MGFDIDRLTRAELVELNHRIVERLKMLDASDAHREMMKFKVGMQVRFEAPGRGTLEGVLIKYNQKTVTVMVGAEKWNVSPQFLESAGERGDVIDLTPVRGGRS